jgi:peptidoglycan/xylan/chitin deacetylase (PgdA/CDA1 family)
MSDEEHGVIDLLDGFVLGKMEWATAFAKLILPRGHWGAKRDGSEPPHVVLTFDDGPVPDTTLPLLDLLDEEGVKATFFVMGRRVKKYPHLLVQIKERGHQIGNHSYNHMFMPIMPTKLIHQEIEDTNQAIFDAIGEKPSIFRPPFGLIDFRAAACLEKNSMQMVYWGPVSEDWLGIGESRVVRRTVRKLNHGALIVLHEGHSIAKQTLGATRAIIRHAKARGYTFDTIRTQ